MLYHLLLFLRHLFLNKFTIGPEPIKRHLTQLGIRIE